MKELLSKLYKIQFELKVPKNQLNSFGKYKYRSCEDILEAVKPLLSKHKVVINLSDKITETNGRIHVISTVTLYCADTGQELSAESVAREGENKKGMDDAQLSGTTVSYARKYALNGMFAIDDTKDSDDPVHYQHQTSKTTQNHKTISKRDVGNKGDYLADNKIKLTDLQVNNLLEVANKSGYEAEIVHKVAFKNYNKNDLKDLTAEEYNDLYFKFEQHTK